MKKLKGLLIFLTLALVMIVPIKAKAANPQKVVLKQNTTYTQYDFTGDGKADEFLFKMDSEMSEDTWCYDWFEVYLNKQLIHSERNAYFLGAQLELYTLSNGKPYLYLYLSYENDDAYCSGLFACKDGKLVQEADFTSIFGVKKYGYHSGGSPVSISGNRVRTSQYIMSYSFGMVRMQYDYKYDKKTDSLKPVASGKVTDLNKKWRKTTKKLTLYKSPKKWKAVRTINKKTKVKITECYRTKKNLYFKVKVKSGRSGWIKALRKTPKNCKPLLEGCFYAG